MEVKAGSVGVTAAELIVPVPSPTLPGPFAVQIQVRGEHTNGVMSVLEETLQPKILIPPHVHPNDVWVRVEEGEIGVLVGDHIRTATEGQWALKPRNVRHAMWNTTTQPARVMEVLTPAGTERWFEEISALEPDDHDGFLAACERHGIRFLDDELMVSRLKKRYGLE
jgi:quercetin dioxygenase-like cupin family protein